MKITQQDLIDLCKKALKLVQVLHNEPKEGTATINEYGNIEVMYVDYFRGDRDERSYVVTLEDLDKATEDLIAEKERKNKEEAEKKAILKQEKDAKDKEDARKRRLEQFNKLKEEFGG